MLYDPTRHEALRSLAWNEVLARETIRRVVHDTEDRFATDRYWPLHPRDVEGDDDPDHVATTLYHGACGVIWALHYLQAVGAATLSRSYLGGLDRLVTRNRAWLNSAGSQGFASFLMGDMPIELLACGDRPDDVRADRRGRLAVRPDAVFAVDRRPRICDLPLGLRAGQSCLPDAGCLFC